MFRKKKQEHAAFRDLMAGFEDLTARMILLYVKGQWDDALGTASVIEVGLQGIATAPRMEICLYHAESMRLRIAYKRRDVEAIRAIAQEQHPRGVRAGVQRGPHADDQAPDTAGVVIP